MPHISQIRPFCCDISCQVLYIQSVMWGMRPQVAKIHGRPGGPGGRPGARPRRARGQGGGLPRAPGNGAGGLPRVEADRDGSARLAVRVHADLERAGGADLDEARALIVPRVVLGGLGALAL